VPLYKTFSSNQSITSTALVHSTTMALVLLRFEIVDKDRHHLSLNRRDLVGRVRYIRMWFEYFIFFDKLDFFKSNKIVNNAIFLE